MMPPLKWVASGLAVLAVATSWIAWRFDSDINAANAPAVLGSVLIDTRCGPIEYQETGTGIPLLMVHGSGGGHDQGIAFAGQIKGAKFVGFEQGGHVWVGHHDEVQAEIMNLLVPKTKP